MKLAALGLAVASGALLTGGVWAGRDLAMAAEKAVLAPPPQMNPASSRKQETVIFAGGCFWGVEGVFSHVKGVTSAVSGYSGGKGQSANYDAVSTGRTGFAEAVRVTYDPRIVRYGDLLRIFFSVVADPTTLNYQGPDHGTQYRSALFPLTPEQAKAARAYLGQLAQSGLWKGDIVTAIEPYRGFVAAEKYHQDFMQKNPRHPYILRWDQPKLAAFKKLFPQHYREKAAG
ncbi:peptide-methionine (S)-S-oxide reductase [Rhizorhapis suberifaciens]|uniref:Peptide methionine sulfoxide reductase MsrA n=2 Tax=Rhizorhapis suberifaciens TaxID=13656 RepID=A0A840HSN2_9SPHN|nr:peptide-methionine (S)-S-oxide reductase [Rhizorhapis suberifaciens]